MATIQQLVDQLNASSPDKQWKLFGGDTPQEDTAPVTIPASPDGQTPAQTVNRGTGLYYVVVQDANGVQRKLPLKANDPALLKAGLELKQSGVNETIPDTTPNAKGQVDPLATKPNPNLYNADLKKVQWDSGGPLADVPQGSTTKQPSPTDKLDQVKDESGKVIALRDPATGTSITVPAGAQPVLHDVGDQVWSVKADGTYTVVGAKPKEPTQLNVPGVGLVEYDPKGTDDATKYHVVMPTPTDVNNLGGIQTRNGKSYYPVKNPDGSIQFVETNLPADVKVTGTYDSADSPYVVFTDQTGKEISRLEKPGWKPPVRVQPGTAPAGDSVNPFIQVFDPTTGELKFVPNQNQVKASDATAQLAKDLGVKIAAGSISEDAAQKLITSAINVQNSQSQKIQAQAAQTTAETGQQSQIATAAGDVLRNTGQNAQTGAGMLNQRVQSATGSLNSILGSVAGSNIMSAPAGIGARLVGGLTDWVTGLGGGDATYETAARMVQAADPKISQDPTLANQAQQTLGAMLKQYQEQTGSPHPLVAATQAANASVQGGGVTAPTTTPDTTSGLQQGQQTNVGVDQALQQQQQANALRARGLQNTPQGAAVAAGQVPIASQGAPTTPGLYNPAWQQAYMSAVGTPSVGPNAANGFVAPLIPVPGQVAPYQQLQPGFVAPIAA